MYRHILPPQAGDLNTPKVSGSQPLLQAAPLLSPAHERMLLEESDIAPDVAMVRGYRTIKSRATLREYGFKDYQRRPGLLVPMHSPDGETVGYQLRPDRPRKGGPKYETPGGISPIIDVHPGMLKEVRSGDGALLITEGAKTGDAATSRGIPTVVLAGVWMWCVPKVRPYRLKPCFDHVRLEGREVFIAFDSDCMSKIGVQDALAALVAALQDRGATVKVIYLPDTEDGSKQGVDDFLSAGGTIREMFMLARSFEPGDLARVRLSRDVKLRAAVEDLWRCWRERDWMRFVGAAKNEKGNWARGHTARDTMEALIELAARNGKPDDRGVVVRVGLRALAEMAAKSAESVRKAVAHLEADGQLEILPPEDKSKARRYRLIVASAGVDSREKGTTREGFSGEGLPRCPPLRYPTAPRLRWSSPGRPRRREFEVVKGTSRVRHTGQTPRDALAEDLEATPSVKRLGPHRGAVLDTLEAAGGELHLKDLCDALHRKRSWDVRRRILKPLEEAGIIECEGDVIRLVDGWLAMLEEERKCKGEIEQAEQQVDKHRDQRARYREYLERERRGTPEASHAAVRRTKKLRERRLRENRQEEERDHAPTPPAVKALVAKIMGQHERIRMALLCEIALEEGLRWRDVPPAVRRMGYRVERLAEYDNAEFVFERLAA